MQHQDLDVLAASERAHSASQRSTRVSVRYASPKATAVIMLGWPGTVMFRSTSVRALIRDCDTVLGTHRPPGAPTPVDLLCFPMRRTLIRRVGCIGRRPRRCPGTSGSVRI